jgi:hypothetical protein
MTRGIRQSFVSLTGFVVVLLGLTAADERVRQHLTNLVYGDSLTPWGHRASDLGGALVDALRYQSIDNAPLLVFVAGGIVLFLFMVRS